MLVLEQVCEQAPYTFHLINSVEPFTENLALARLGIASDFWKSWHHQLISFSVTHMHGTIALYHRYKAAFLACSGMATGAQQSRGGYNQHYNNHEIIVEINFTVYM